MNETVIRCLECDWETGTFQAECGRCGGCEFRRTTPGCEQTAETGVKQTLSKLSRPLNPLAPR